MIKETDEDTPESLIVETLVKKYYKIITERCIENSAKIEQAFNIRKKVITRLYEVVVKNKGA